MYNLETEKKQKHKLLAIAGVMVAVIILLIAAIAIVATNKTTKKSIGGEQNTEIMAVEDEIKEDNVNDKASDVDNSEALEIGTITTDTASETVTSSVVAGADNLPTTGPEDLVPLAIAMGAITTAATAAVMHKRNS